MLVITRGEHRNVYHIGTLDEVSIAELAAVVLGCFGREADIRPQSLPEGSTLRRCPDIGKLAALGFSPRVPLAQGVARTTEWYLADVETPTVSST